MFVWPILKRSTVVNYDSRVVVTSKMLILRQWSRKLRSLRFATVGKEPWSSAYGRRLMSVGRGFKPQHRILDGHFSHLFVVKIVFEKTKIK